MEEVTYYVFRDSIVINFFTETVQETQTIAKDDPRFEEVSALIKKGELGEIPDVVQRTFIKKLLCLK